MYKLERWWLIFGSIDYEITFRVVLFDLNLELYHLSRVGVFALNCSLATLCSSSTSSYCPLWLWSEEVRDLFWREPLNNTNQGELSKKRKILSCFEKLDKAHTLCLKRTLSQHMLCKSIDTLQASKVSPCGQHWAWKTVFLSQWFYPHGLSSL